MQCREPLGKREIQGNFYTDLSDSEVNLNSAAAFQASNWNITKD